MMLSMKRPHFRICYLILLIVQLCLTVVSHGVITLYQESIISDAILFIMLMHLTISWGRPQASTVLYGDFQRDLKNNNIILPGRLGK